MPLPGATQVDAVVGCYDLEVGAWTPELPEGLDSLLHSPPPRIRLDAAQSERVPYMDPEKLAVLPAPGSPPAVHRTAFWQPLGEDSVFVLWHEYHSGVQLRLAPGDDGLRGTARRGWRGQGGSPGSRIAPAFARRTPCSAPVPEAWGDYRRLPREVELTGDRSVRLRERLPAGVRLREGTDPRGTLTPVYGAEPVGLFAGASGIAVTLTIDGMIRRITLDGQPDPELDALVERIAGVGIVRAISVRFPSGTDYDDLLDRIAAAYGSPTGRGETSATWSGRDTRVLLFSSDGRIRIRMYDPRYYF